MSGQQTRPILGLLAVATFGAGVWSAMATASGGMPPPPDKIALGENEVKELVMLMDHDRNGKVSKAEYTAFMDAEFARLDKDGSGELDVNELKKSQLRSSTTFLSKGK